MPQYECPYCGHKQTSAVYVNSLKELGYGKLTKILIHALVDAYNQGAGLTMENLIEASYGDDIDGGPITAQNCISSRLWYLRRKLIDDVGWTVDNGPKGMQGTLFKLTPVDK